MFNVNSFAVRTGNWTTVSSIRRVESHFHHWIWASTGRFSFWGTWWQALSQLHIWMSYRWHRGWQVDHQSGFSTMCFPLFHISHSVSSALSWFLLKHTFANWGTCNTRWCCQRDQKTLQRWFHFQWSNI